MKASGASTFDRWAAASSTTRDRPKVIGRGRDVQPSSDQQSRGLDIGYLKAQVGLAQRRAAARIAHCRVCDDHLPKPCDDIGICELGGLFDQIDAGVVEKTHAEVGFGLAPVLVDVNANASAIPQRLLDGSDMLDIVPDGALADLQLEDVVAPRSQHLLGLVDIPLGISARKRPGDREALPDTSAADQVGYRNAEALPFASRRAVSTVHLAMWLPATLRPILAIVSATRLASLSSRIGVM